MGYDWKKLRYALVVANVTNIDPKDVPLMDVIQFQSNSKNESVGKGKGEYFSEEANRIVDRSQYHIFKFLDGRAILSNFTRVEIVVGGRRYPSVEHAFHAGKALLMENIEEASKFECDGEYASFNGIKIKSKGGRKGSIGDMSKKMLIDNGSSVSALLLWNMREGYRVMNEAIRARASADKVFRTVILATGKAILVHQTRGTQDERLSRILHTLRNEMQCNTKPCK